MSHAMTVAPPLEWIPIYFFVQCHDDHRIVVVVVAVTVIVIFIVIVIWSLLICDSFVTHSFTCNGQRSTDLCWAKTSCQSMVNVSDRVRRRQPVSLKSTLILVLLFAPVAEWSSGQNMSSYVWCLFSRCAVAVLLGWEWWEKKMLIIMNEYYKRVYKKDELF